MLVVTIVITCMPGNSLSQIINRGNGLIYDTDLDITCHDFPYRPVSLVEASNSRSQLKPTSGHGLPRADLSLVELEALLARYDRDSRFPKVADDAWYSDSDEVIRVLRADRLRSVLWDMVAPDDQLIAYWTKRMLDAGFAKALCNRLGRIPGYERDADLLNRAAATYRKMETAERQVRHHQDISDKEKEELIARADVPGRRRAVGRILRRILNDMGFLDRSNNSEWAVLFELMNLDLIREWNDAEKARWEKARMLKGMRQAILDAYLKDRALDLDLATIAKANKARDVMEEAKRDLVFNMDGIGVQQESLFQYALAIADYDRQVIGMFDAPGIRNNDKGNLLLNGVFPHGDSLYRQIALLKHGYKRFAASLLLGLAKEAEAYGYSTRSDDCVYLSLSFALAALAADPTFAGADAHVNRILKRIDGLAPDQDTPVTPLVRGYNLALTGDYSRARDVLEKGFRTDPSDEKLFDWLLIATYGARGWEAAFKMEISRYPGRKAVVEGRLKELLDWGFKTLAEKAELAGMHYVALRHLSVRFGLSYGKIPGVYTKAQRKLLEKIIRLYTALPFKPTPPPLAVRYASQGEQLARAGRWQEAEHAYRQAIATAPWWADAHYNAALIWYAGLEGLPASVVEMKIYLNLGGPGDPKRAEGLNRLRHWQAAIDEYVSLGATVPSDMPYLIYPDRERW